jgi:hypothetical protein
MTSVCGWKGYLLYRNLFSTERNDKRAKEHHLSWDVFTEISQGKKNDYEKGSFISFVILLVFLS